MDFLYNIFIIIAVVLIFNFVIFVHELGHFLAAKWRGMEVDRFQIWFGKPIWKKTIGGVQYGLGFIPFGGFVSLPQMASMEGAEGKVEGEDKRGLKAAPPLDRIIVAFAGPLFSFGLAVVVACVVWGVGKPDTRIDTTTLGYVQAGSPAAIAGLQAGDKIIEVEGNAIDCWAGPPETSLVFNIALSEGDTVDFKIIRDGKEMEISSGFEIPETTFYQRRAMRRVGIMHENVTIVKDVYPNGPAALAGLKSGDVVTHVNGQAVYSPSAVHSEALAGKPFEVTYTRQGEVLKSMFTPQKPIDSGEFDCGIKSWDYSTSTVYSEGTSNPTPLAQVSSHVRMMWTTITKVISPKSSIGPQHLQSPVGIGLHYFDLLKIPDHGWRLMLVFTVLLNVNLAILNLLPLPVLDGGHITTSFFEIIFRKPIPARIMITVQNSFVLVLFSFMLFILFKDVGDRASKDDGVPEKIEFAAPSAKASEGAENNDLEQ